MRDRHVWPVGVYFFYYHDVSNNNIVPGYVGTSLKRFPLILLPEIGVLRRSLKFFQDIIRWNHSEVSQKKGHLSDDLNFFMTFWERSC